MNQPCHFEYEDGSRCIAPENSSLHDRNLGDPGTGQLTWFVSPNHLFRDADFGQTDWPEYTRIQFRAAA